MSQTLQESISAATQNFITNHNMSLHNLGEALGLSKSAIWAKLHGTRRWSVDELDRLVGLGVWLCAPSVMELARWQCAEACVTGLRVVEARLYELWDEVGRRGGMNDSLALFLSTVWDALLPVNMGLRPEMKPVKAAATLAAASQGIPAVVQELEANYPQGVSDEVMYAAHRIVDALKNLAEELSTAGLML